jgi:hypothetical protein
MSRVSAIESESVVEIVAHRPTERQHLAEVERPSHSRREPDPRRRGNELARAILVRYDELVYSEALD